MGWEVYTVKKETFMGENQDNIGEAHIAERIIRHEVKIPSSYNDGIDVFASNMIFCSG